MSSVLLITLEVSYKNVGLFCSIFLKTKSFSNLCMKVVLDKLACVLLANQIVGSDDVLQKISLKLEATISIQNIKHWNNNK